MLTMRTTRASVDTGMIDSAASVASTLLLMQALGIMVYPSMWPAIGSADGWSVTAFFFDVPGSIYTRTRGFATDQHAESEGVTTPGQSPD
jgi:hypothetical protein